MQPTIHIITGAAGFIGSHLTDRLLAEGVQILGIDDLSLGKRKNVQSALQNPGFKLHVGDLNDRAAVSQSLAAFACGRKIDTLWHLAANSDIQAGIANPDIDFDRTFRTTYSAIQLCRAHRVRHLLFASTSAIYGELPGPLAESSGPLFPISNYGAMKLASEGALAAATTDCLDWLGIARFPNIVGSRSTHGVIHDFLAKLESSPNQLVVLGDGKQEKPYLHVNDLIDGLLFIRYKCPESIACYNLGDGVTASTVSDIAEMVIARKSPHAKIHFTGGGRGWVGDVAKFQYDTSKIRSRGWAPTMTSGQAIARAIDELLMDTKTSSCP